MDTNIIPIQLDYRFVTTRKIWQYDYGQILSITGQNLPTATEVHFSLDIRGGSTLSRVGTTMDGVTTVKIPDELLKNNGKSGDFSIYAFIYVTDEESGNTEYRITIPVYSRPKPENPSVDPAPEPNIFHETVTAVNNAADRAEKAAKDTEQIRDNLNLDLSEKITRPQSAKVGQVIAVKEVGTDGKPTDFEAKDMTGGASTEEIKEAVGAYMQEHPFEETDPTVPDWAKRPEKPTYTAEDVGALPDNTKIPTKTSELENDSGFLYSPPTPEVGKILKIKSVNEDGTFTCEWADDGGSNLDVRINGESIVQDGVAEIPISSHDTLGLVYTDNSAGGYTTGLMNQQGRLKVNTASIDDVNKRRLRKEIDCSNFDYVVKAAMCDGKGAAWTAEEQAAARARIGALDTQDMIDITEITMDAETLKYVFPSFADYRILEISFSKTKKEIAGLTGNIWLKTNYAHAQWIVTSTFADMLNIFTLDTSGKSCIGKNVHTNNTQIVIGTQGLIVDKEYWNTEFRGSPYLLLPNTEWAQYCAECNTIIKVRGVKR
jgi:hypothetical protein|nr:MAG TPA: hypothetical protein [Caudoviricetes sp.]